MSSPKRNSMVAAVCAVCSITLAACGGGSDNSPAPGPGVQTSVTVASSGGPVYIGSTVAFEARETLSNGTTRTAASANWSSDKPQIASVSGQGQVSGVAAGEATISADVSGTRGSLLVRVYPNFAGSWSGTETGVSCSDSGDLTGFCSLGGFVGQSYFHESSFTQNLGSVTGVLRLDESSRATMPGTITTDGEAQLSSAEALPADPDVKLRVENWRSRADVPSRMSGTYEILVTVTGLSGSARVGVRFDNVSKTSASTAAAPLGRGIGSKLRAHIRQRVRTS